MSGGQRQTINLAQLTHDPKILLWTSPQVDGPEQKKVVESIKAISAEKTMLIVTHRNPIFSLVDRVFVLENGSIVGPNT